MNPPAFEFGPALLFCPASRPDRFAKALDRADAVILDLEDGVSATNRPAAREALVATPLEPSRVIVRVNAVGTDDFALDVLALARTNYRTVMLPKCERPSDIDAVGDLNVIALCETARGVLAADHIAEHPQVAALMWGAEDLTVSTGGTSSRHSGGRYRDVAAHARARVLLAAAAAGRAAIDAVHVQLDDFQGLAAEASDACAQGFRATACLHPTQVPVVREAYRPSDEAIDWATKVITAAASEGGATRLDGAMIDEPLIRQARAVLQRAGRSDNQDSLRVTREA
ncbi:MAG TPA: CoA ester lyase [Candidatus Lumbricidophila sp.]|nr:CoA ester lyase [Candidatus Lumbricidophila sp.]